MLDADKSEDPGSWSRSRSAPASGVSSLLLPLLLSAGPTYLPPSSFAMNKLKGSNLLAGSGATEDVYQFFNYLAEIKNKFLYSFVFDKIPTTL